MGQCIGLDFADLQDETGRIQLMATREAVGSDELHEFSELDLGEAIIKDNELKMAVQLAEKVGFPSWVEVDPKKMTGTFKGAPDRSEFGQDINESLVVELYSK